MTTFFADLFTKLGLSAGTALSLGNALTGFLILVIGLFLVKYISQAFSKILSKISLFKRKMSSGETLDLVPPITALTKGLLTLFVLIAVLEHFGMDDVLAPLKELLNKFLNVIPNIIGCGVVLYAGWIIASMASKVGAVALSKLDQQISKKTNSSEIKIAPFGSAFIFAGVLLPIVVAALGILNIPAITVPASVMIQKLMSAIPNIVGAAIILIVVYITAKFIIFVLNGLLSGISIDHLPKKLGIANLFSAKFTLTKLIDGAIMFFAMLAAATAAVEILEIDVISLVFARILEFGGGLLTGGIILIIGNFLSNLAHQKLVSAGSTGLAKIARVAIIGLVLAMGLKSMGLADSIVTMAFGFTIGSVAIATALAFGLGGREAAKSITDQWARKINKQ